MGNFCTTLSQMISENTTSNNYIDYVSRTDVCLSVQMSVVYDNRQDNTPFALPLSNLGVKSAISLELSSR